MKNKEKYKKIGLAFVSFFLMVSIAGYINYRYDPEREKNLGQTVYVSTNNDEVKIYEEEKEPVKDIEQEEDTVISKYREDRDNMYMELANSYSSVVNNNNTSQETLTEYQQKLANVIVEADNLDDSFIAQIVDVIVENFAISPENITIESVNV